MAEPDKDEVARALDRLASSKSGTRGSPTPQPKPRSTPQPKARPTDPSAPAPAVKNTRPATPRDLSTKPPSAAGQELASFAATQRSQGRRKALAPAPSAGTGLRRTLIPILLTGGGLLFALATIHFAWDSVDNPTADLPRSIVLTLYVLGIVCWGVAAANMVGVRREIQNLDANPKSEARNPKQI